MLKLSLATVLFVIIGAVGSGCDTPSSSSTSDEVSSEGSSNPDCTHDVKSHINRQRGKEINFISKVGNGKYVVNIIDMNIGEDYSATIYTDSDCNVTSVSVN